MSGARAAAEREEFAAFFPQIVRDLTEDMLGHPEVGDAVARLKQVRTGGRRRRARGWGTGKVRAAQPAALPQVLEYNAPGGKCNRGLTVVAAFRRLAERQEPGSLRCALAVGWCIELVRTGTPWAWDPRGLELETSLRHF